MRPNLRQFSNVLLGLMTLFTFGGAFAILLTIRGGQNAYWPPDRPVEWTVFSVVMGGVAVLFLACMAVAWRLSKSPRP